MTRPALSVLIPIRDRGGLRVENCLRSLRWQELDALRAHPHGAEVEIVLVDFGSDAGHARELADFAARFSTAHVRVDTGATWNRARALNYGIQAARARLVMATDADMIFAPNFLATVIAAQRELREGAFVVCRCRDLPPDLPAELAELADRPLTAADFPALLELAPYREALGTGACQVATREFFERVRGYDEGYEFWGMEDNDMRARARRFGLRERWIHQRTAMLHQWHPSQRGRRPWRKLANDVRFHLSKGIVVKNWRGWGGRRGPGEAD